MQNDPIPNRKLFKTKQKTSIRAEKPKEIIHADVCIFRPLDHTKYVTLYPFPKKYSPSPKYYLHLTFLIRVVLFFW